MMELSGLALVAMILVMIVMCGGMAVGAGWALIRRRRRPTM
jgi:hypothetical protein